MRAAWPRRRGGAAGQQAIAIVVERLRQDNHQPGSGDPARRHAAVERALGQCGVGHPPFAKFFERGGQGCGVDCERGGAGLFERAFECGLALDRRRGGRGRGRYGILALGLDQPAARLIREIGIDPGLAPPVERAFEALQRGEIACVQGIGVHHSSVRRS
ncbi:hypothetical protein WKH79_04550 [Qipengyuania sp. GPGPB31]|uniref:hypothetical protein n=1 Tax=Qipengyuania sp. GPGPB31 TaxID=3023518 RepID=UPI0031342AF6